MILVLDNRDSFTFNLVQELQALGAQVLVLRADRSSAEAALAVEGLRGVVVGPGPGPPDSAGCSEELIQRLASRAARTERGEAPSASPRIPLLGVCLGHQALATAFGGEVMRSAEPVHGATRAIDHDGTGVLLGVPSPFQMARYNSLAVDVDSLPGELRITARTRDGEIAGLAHRRWPMYGVQGHPESILCVEQGGRGVLSRFLELCRLAELA